jgi:hypothetical protein
MREGGRLESIRSNNNLGNKTFKENWLSFGFLMVEKMKNSFL